MKRFKTCFLFAFFLAIFALAGCDGGRPDGAQTPRFDGMTISDESPVFPTRLQMSKFDTYYEGENPTVVEGETEEETEEPAEQSESSQSEVINLPEDNMPPMPENADIEENLLPSISVSQEANVTPYYADVNQDVFISVRIINPKSYAILRFTLNGTIYQSYQFEDGSTSELLVLKVNSGATPGIKEYTIDEIKYISDEDNSIRDCIIEGNQTIKLSVGYDKLPTAVIENETMDYTSYLTSISVSDPYDLVDFNSNGCKLYFFDGEKILKEQVIQKGVNSFSANGLALGKNYQYMIVANYDRLDEDGFSTHVLLKRDVNTAAFVRIINAEATYDSISFDYRVLNTMATVKDIYLIKDGEAIKKLDTEKDQKVFNNLYSNNKYQIRVYYDFELDGKEYHYYDAYTFTTLAYKKPSLNASIKVYESSVEYTVHVDDENNLINLKNVKLYTQNGDFVANVDYDTNLISNLNRNTNYYLHFVYSYNLNDGLGEIEAEKVVPFSTSKAVPVVEIKPYRATSNLIGFDIFVTDPNVVGTINSIRLFDENGNFINQLNNLALREFSGLNPNTKYVIEVGYVYDLDDGNGSQVITFKQEMSTARQTPTVDYTVNVGKDSATIVPAINDPHSAGSIKSITFSDGTNEIAADLTTLKAENLLSNHDYHVTLVYKYDLLDLKGTQEFVVEKDIKTNSKVFPTFVINGNNVDYSSFELAIREVDPDNVAKVNKVTLSLGTLEVATRDNLEDLKFDGLYSNTRYTVTVDFEYDLNDGNGLIKQQAVGYVSTLKRDNISVSYKDMQAGEDFIDFGLDIVDKDNLMTIKKIEIFDENEQLVESLDDLSKRKFENLEKEAFYTIVTTYEFDLGDGKGVQSDSATILYGTSGSQLYVNYLEVLNNENPKVGDEVQVLVKLDNPHNLEVTGIYISDVFCEVLNNSSVKGDVIVKFIPDTEGGYYTVTVTGYQYVTSGVTLDDRLTSEYEEEILVMGELSIVDYFAITDTYYENYSSTYMRMLEVYNPTGYEIYEIKYLNSYWGGDNSESKTTNFKKVDDNHIIIFEQGIYDNGIYDLVLTGITYGLEDVQRTTNISYLHCYQNTYNNIIHISTKDELLALGTGNVNAYNNNQSPNYYILDNDIDCSGTPWEGLVASGVFDGNGHTISNIRTVIEDEGQVAHYYGLFKSFRGIIFNLTVENAYFSVKTPNAKVYVAGISAANGRVYDSVVKNTTFAIEADQNSSVIAGISINGDSGEYGSAPRLSTNNIVDNLVIKTNVANTSLITDRNYYSIRMDGYRDNTQTIYLDAGGLESIAINDSYIQKGDVVSYELYRGDTNNSGSIYVNRTLANVTYHIHANCDAYNDFDQVGLAINAINVTREGYTVAWYDNPEFTGEPITFPYISTEKVDLYAKWTRIVLAPETYTYMLSNWWDSVNQVNVEGYVITSFNINPDEPNTLIIGGYYEGKPVLNCTYEATRELRRTEYSDDDWEAYRTRMKNFTVYYLDTFNPNVYTSDVVKGMNVYLTGKYTNLNYYTEFFWNETTQTQTHTNLIVPKEYETFYNEKFFKNDTNVKVQTYTYDDNPYDALDLFAPTDDENMSIRVSATDADNLLESVKYDKDVLPYTIEEGENGVRYLDYNNTKFAIIDSNIYVGVKDIVSDDVFRYIIYENDEVVIDKLYNKNLQNIDLTALPYTVSEIASSVFQNSNVKTIVLNEGLKTIGDRAFDSSKLTSVTFPSTLVDVGRYAFYNCQLTKVVMNDNITRIKSGTFQSNYNLRDIKFSSKLKHIENNAFLDCQLSNIVLPYGLQSIGEQAFHNWNEMTAFVPSTVKTMTCAFNASNYNCTIYTSLSTKPNGWRFTWNEEDTNVRLSVFYNIKEVKENDDYRYLVKNDGDIIISKYIGSSTNTVIVEIPEEEGNIVEIANRAFYRDGNAIKCVILPASVNSVAGESFSNETQILSKATFAGTGWNDEVASRTSFDIREVVNGEDFVYALDSNNNATILGLSKPYVKSTVDFDLGDGISVVSICDRLFENNRFITNVILPTSLTRIGSYAFRYSTITSVNIPSQVKTIEANTFAECYSLKELTLNEGLETIGRYAFSWCSNLYSVTLPQTLQTIGEQAFYYTQIKQFVIPQSVSSVGYNALYSDQNIIIVHENDKATPAGWNENYRNTNNSEVIFNGEDNYILLVVDARFEGNQKTVYTDKLNAAPTFVISDGVILGWYVDPEFNEEATFPFEATERLTYLYAKVQKSANRVWVNYSNGSTTWGYRDGYAPLVVSAPSLFKEGYYLEGWYLDNALTIKVDFPFAATDSVTFYPKWVAINETESEDHSYYYYERDGGIVISQYCGIDTVVDLSGIEGLVGIGDNAFKDLTNITEVVLPSSVKYIYDNAFSGCNSLTTINLPDTLESIGDRSFYQCYNLALTELPDGLLSIGSRAFYNCDTITLTTLPGGLQSIGYEAFNSCNGLTEIAIPEGITSIDQSTFSNCYNLRSVTLPDTLKSIGSYAFRGCLSLKNITLPDGLLSIGSYAFNSTGIRILVVPDSVENVSEYGLCIDSNGVVIHNGDSKTPAGWNTNCFGGEYDSKPEVIYNSARRYVVLVADNLSIKVAYLNQVAQTTLESTGYTWYTDSAFENPVTFTDGYFGADLDQRITYIYGKAA